MNMDAEKHLREANEYWDGVFRTVEVYKGLWGKEHEEAPVVPAKIVEAAKKCGFIIRDSKLY